jgi:dolichol-phosphate mannosyltransferase
MMPASAERAAEILAAVSPGDQALRRVRPALLSVVIPVLNEERNVPEIARRLHAVLDSATAYEVIFVNDGSTDATPTLLRRLHEDDERFKSLHLARNFGHQTAISAGLRAAAGDAVVIMDGDLQDAPEVIPEFLRRWRDGYDVVYAIRSRRQAPWAKRVAYRTFYQVLHRLSQIDIPLDSGDFSLMDRRVVDEINAMPERTRFVRGLRSWVGFRQTGVEVFREARHAGQPKYTLRRLLRLALDGFFGFSYRPLQLASIFGLGVSALALLLAVTLVLLRVTSGVPLQGWTSLMVAVLFLGGVQLISLGILGEYVGRIYDEARGRPAFVVASVVGDTRLIAARPTARQ